MYLYDIYKHTPVTEIMTSLTGVSAHYLRHMDIVEKVRLFHVSEPFLGPQFRLVD